MKRCFVVLLLSVIVSSTLFAARNPQPVNLSMAVPLFEPNVGQIYYANGDPVSYIHAQISTPHGTAYLHNNGMHIVLTQSRIDNKGASLPSLIQRTDISFLGGNPNPRHSYSEVQPNTVRYIGGGTGPDGTIAQYARVLTYHEVWPKIDVRSTATENGVKVDYIVHPGGNPADIVLLYTGINALTSSEQGVLTVHTELGLITEDAPVAWTESVDMAQHKNVTVTPVINGKTIRFSVSGYNKNQTLIIDPRRVWATYYGGNKITGSFKTAVDPDGNVFVGGTTSASNFPRSSGVTQGSFRSRTDGFMAKFTDEGKFLWHTYFGGRGIDRFNDIDADDLGNVWAVGMTDTTDHPQIIAGSGPFGNPDSLVKNEGIIVQFNGKGLMTDWWYFYGRDDDEVFGVDVRGNNLAVVGTSNSVRVGERVGTPGTKDPTNNFKINDMFVAKFYYNTATATWPLDWLTFYGGTNEDLGVAVGLDVNGNVYATGSIRSTTVPTTDGSNTQGNGDVVVIRYSTPTRFNPVMTWATVFGTNQFDQVYDLAVDFNGNPMVVGYTRGTGFPLTNAVKNGLTGVQDGYIRKFNPANGAPTFSSYIGGNGADQLTCVTTDNSNKIWIGGSTVFSSDIVTTPDAVRSTLYSTADNLEDGFMQQLSENGQNVVYGTYYGAPPQAVLPPPPPTPPGPGDIPPPNTDYGQEQIWSITCDKNAYVIVGSLANTRRMDVTSGAFQDTTAVELKKDTTTQHGFLSFFSNCPAGSVVINSSAGTVLCPGESKTLSVPSGSVKYLWSNGELGASITVNTPGSYWVAVTNSDGCRFRDTLEITSSVPPVVSAGTDITTCKDSPVKLSVNVTGGRAPFTFLWNRLESGQDFIDDVNLVDPTVNPPTTSRYEISVSDSLGCVGKDTIQVIVQDPRPSFVPTTVAFGTLGSCQSSADTIVTIRNPHQYAISITEFASNSTAISIVTSLAQPLVIPASSSRDVRVRVSPTTAGTTNGTFTLRGTPCIWAVNIPFTASKAALTATILPGNITFPAVAVCQATPIDTFVVVRNNGTSPLTLQSGSVSAPYSIVGQAPTTVLQPLQDTVINLRYTPTVAGVFNATARFPYNAGNCIDTLTVAMNSTVVDVSVTQTPNNIDVGLYTGCDDSKDTVVEITNTSDVNISVNIPTSAGLQTTPSGVVTIAAGQTLKVAVSVRPTSTGAFSEQLVVTTMPCNISTTTTFSGTKSGNAFNVPSEVNFGEFSACNPGTLQTRTASISFGGTSGVGTVTSVMNTSSALTTTLAPGTVLNPDTPVDFTVTWTPTQDGALVDSIVLTLNPCAVRRVIRVVGVRTSVGIASAQATIPLGNVATTATGTTRFTNSGTDTIQVEVVALSPDISITMQRPPASTNILPGGTIDVDYVVLCNNRATIADSLKARISAPCSAPERVVTFNGQCTGKVPVTSVISIDSVSVNVGDRFRVPIRLLSQTGVSDLSAKTWEASITYNPMVVVGMGSTPDCFVSGQFAPCTITISGTATDTVGVLAELDFTAVLGNAERTSLTVTDFSWTQDAQADITTIDGEVELADLCRVGGTRLLTPRTSGFTISVYPTPASTELNIELIGLGTDVATYTITDFLGTVVTSGTIFPTTSQNGLALVNVSAFSPGTYFLNLTARGTNTRASLIITR